MHGKVQTMLCRGIEYNKKGVRCDVVSQKKEAHYCFSTTKKDKILLNKYRKHC